MYRKYKNIIISLLLAFIIIAFNYTYISAFISSYSVKGSRVIIIDAGHGGIDGGAVGKSGTIEKVINLSIAQKIKAYIEGHGDTCIMVREVDEGLYSEYGTIRNKKQEDLKKRKDIIREYDADIFISIHLNSFPQSQYYGAQVFYMRGDEKSEALAKKIQEELIKTLDRNNKRAAKPAENYFLLDSNSIPSILVECGFLSNPEEERLLNDEGYQNKIAWAIYSGLMKYFDEFK